MSGGHASSEAMLVGVIVILTAIVLLSVAFEKGKEHLLHTVEKHVKPIINSLFSELTLLGFIGLLLFITIQSGVLKSISKKTHFAHEEPADAGLALTHLIELVHIVLFGVMIIFLVLVITLTFYGRYILKGWRVLEEICGREAHLSNHKKAALQSEDTSEAEQEGGSLDMWLHSFFEANRSPVRATYFAIRKRFIENFTQSKTVAGSDTVVDKKLVDSRFEFAEYLASCMGHLLAEIVEIPVHTWVALEFIFIGMMCIMLAPENIRMILITILGYLLVAFQWILLRKLFSIRHQLMVPLRVAPRNHKRMSYSKARESHANIIVDQDVEPLYLRKAHANGHLEEHDEAEGGFFHRLMGKIFHHDTTPYESLFWFGRHGPEFVVMLMRLLLLLNSIYIAIIVILPILHAVQWHDVTHNAGAQVILYIVTAIPPFIFFYLSSKSISVLVIVMNIEQGTDPEIVAQTVRAMKTKKALGAMKILSAMKLKNQEEDLKEGRSKPEVTGVIDLSNEHIPEPLSQSVPLFAAVLHKIFVTKKFADGWKEGPINVEAKYLPELAAFSSLPDVLKAPFVDAASDLFKIISSFNYSVTLDHKNVNFANVADGIIDTLVAECETHPEYKNKEELIDLAEAIAHNAHLSWKRREPLEGEFFFAGMDASNWEPRTAESEFVDLSFDLQHERTDEALASIVFLAHFGFKLTPPAAVAPEASDRSDIREAFEKFDEEKTGKIRNKDVPAALNKLKWNVSKKEIHKVILTLDPNLTGFTTFEAFKKWVITKESTANLDIEKIILHTFRRIDVDGSGSITAQEFQAALQGMGGEDLDFDDINQIMTEADKDGDGQIDQHEFMAMMKKLVSQG